MTIRLAKPTFDEEDLARISEILASGMLVQGRFVDEFEAAVSNYLGRAAVACSSGTAALHLAVMALGLGPDDEVILPAFTWPSTAHVVALRGATPVFVDIDPDTLALQTAAAIDAITERTKAILPVHLFGIPAPMEKLLQAAREHDVAVIEDAACALGTTTDDGTFAGTRGRIGCFSFHPRKSITTGEGGIVAVADPALEELVRSLRNHGQRRGPAGVTFEHAGLNYRMTEISGALGIGQFAKFGGILARRRELGRRYLDALDTLPSVRIPAGLAEQGNSFQSLVIDVGDAERRARIRAGLSERDIQSTVGTYAVTSQPLYQREYGVAPSDFPHASHAMDALLTLPLHAEMSADDVDTVVGALRALL